MTSILFFCEPICKNEKAIRRISFNSEAKLCVAKLFATISVSIAIPLPLPVAISVPLPIAIPVSVPLIISPASSVSLSPRSLHIVLARLVVSFLVLRLPHHVCLHRPVAHCHIIRPRSARRIQPSNDVSMCHSKSVSNTTIVPRSEQNMQWTNRQGPEQNWEIGTARKGRARESTLQT